MIGQLRDRQSVLGEYFGDGLRITNESAGVSNRARRHIHFATKPFKPAESAGSEGREGGFTELNGSPDLVIEVVSDSSEDKDTDWQMRAYLGSGHRANIGSSTLGRSPCGLTFIRSGSKGFAAVRKSAGWVSSHPVLGHSFRLESTQRRRSEIRITRFASADGLRLLQLRLPLVQQPADVAVEVIHDWPTRGRTPPLATGRRRPPAGRQLEHHFLARSILAGRKGLERLAEVPLRQPPVVAALEAKAKVHRRLAQEPRVLPDLLQFADRFLRLAGPQAAECPGRACNARSPGWRSDFSRSNSSSRALISLSSRTRTLRRSSSSGSAFSWSSVSERFLRNGSNSISAIST